MKATWFLGLVLLVSVGCSPSKTPVVQPTQAPFLPESAPATGEPTGGTMATRTPWPTLAPPITLAPEPTTRPAATSGITGPVPTPRPTLAIICPSNRLQPAAGAGLVPIYNYVGQGEVEVTIQSGRTTLFTCRVPANSPGYVQLDPGTYGWSATVPGKKVGRTQGSVNVSAGVNLSSIVLCLVDNALATLPQCPSGGAGLGAEPGTLNPSGTPK